MFSQFGSSNQPRAFLALLIMGMISACSQQSSNSPTVGTALFPAKPADLRLSLVDAPNDQFSSVVVNVDHMEIMLNRGNKKARVIAGDQLGAIDLLKLQNGTSLTVLDLQLPEGVFADEIRLVLKSEGNYAVFGDGSLCPLKTPSATHSGIKIKLSNPISFQTDYSYGVVVDFDASQSVKVHQTGIGNGDDHANGSGDHNDKVKGNGNPPECILVPVLKLKSCHRIHKKHLSDDGRDHDDTAESVCDGNDESDHDHNGGFDDDDDCLVIDHDKYSTHPVGDSCMPKHNPGDNCGGHGSSTTSTAVSTTSTTAPLATTTTTLSSTTTTLPVSTTTLPVNTTTTTVIADTTTTSTTLSPSTTSTTNPWDPLPTPVTPSNVGSFFTTTP